MMAVKIYFHLNQDGDGYPPVSVESLWCQHGKTRGEYIIDSIPFFVSAATVGDTVAARKRDGVYWFERRLARSGNSLVRITFFDRTRVDDIRGALERIGCAVEQLTEYNLMAVDIPSTTAIGDVQAILRSEADAGIIDYEEPILRQPS